MQKWHKFDTKGKTLRWLILSCTIVQQNVGLCLKHKGTILLEMVLKQSSLFIQIWMQDMTYRGELRAREKVHRSRKKIEKIQVFISEILQRAINVECLNTVGM